MGELHIRKARADDAQLIADNNRAMALETESRKLDPELVIKGTQGLLKDPGKGFYLLAQRQAEVVGQLMVTLEWSDWRNADFWWIQSVYVSPQVRRQGVFRALFEDLHHRAQDSGQVCGLRLYADRDNLSAQQVYRNLGMDQTHYLMFELDWSPVA